MKLSLLVSTAISLCIPVWTCQAGQPIESKQVVSSAFPFEKGDHEFQALLGAFYSFNHSPSMGYAIGSVRLGWMLSTPSGEGFCRGNTEFLLEAFGGGIFEGPGSYLAGGTLLLRYNFVQPESKWVPYFQIGAGGLYSDASKDQNQRLIGSEFEFNLQGGLGLRYFVSERCAVVLEAQYRHISNASLASRNVGVDALGGMLGISLFY
jgi:lipid A 3-O-deacylase